MAEDETILTAPSSVDTGSGGSSAEAKTSSDSSSGDGTRPGGTDEGSQSEINYELNFPDGVEANQATLDDVTAYAKEHKLSNEQAQAQLNREIDLLTKGEEQYIEKHQQLLKDTTAKWLEEVKADPEIGGDKFDLSVSKAKRVIDKFGSDKLKQALNESGLGNHPEVVRMFAKIGETDLEDTHEKGGGPIQEQESPADVLYPEYSK